MQKTINVMTEAGVQPVELWKVLNVEGLRVALHWAFNQYYNPELVASDPLSGYRVKAHFTGPKGGVIKRDFVQDNKKLSEELAREQLRDFFTKIGLDKVKATFSSKPKINEPL